VTKIIVMAGLDPAIHAIEDADARIKSGHDEFGLRVSVG
jgi:hypothetical protein